MRGTSVPEWRPRPLRPTGSGTGAVGTDRRPSHWWPSVGWGGPVARAANLSAPGGWAAVLITPSKGGLTRGVREDESGRPTSYQLLDSSFATRPVRAMPSSHHVFADIRAYSPEDQASLERHIARLRARAEELDSELKRVQSERELIGVALDVAERHLQVTRTLENDELDPWFKELRGTRAVDFLISMEPHRDHTPAELSEAMLGNGWMPADLKAPVENARGALNRLVRQGLAIRVGPGRYRTTRTKPLLHEMDID